MIEHDCRHRKAETDEVADEGHQVRCEIEYRNQKKNQNIFSPQPPEFLGKGHLALTETHQSDDEPFAILHILEHDTEKCSAHNADEGNGNTAETRNQVAFGITEQSHKSPQGGKTT